MHTVETETHAPARFPFLRSEDTTLATIASWVVGVPILTLAGFYFGSVAGHENHPVRNAANPRGHVDLQPHDLQSAIPFAIGGCVIGIIFALCVTLLYVPAKLRELQHEQGGH